MFLVNSRQGIIRCGSPCGEQALSRSYGRFFAEFLEDLSLVRLGLLDQTTCVGLRYGHAYIVLRRFSRKRARYRQRWRTSTFPRRSEWRDTDFPISPPHDADAHPIVRDIYSTPSLHRIHARLRNINRMSIAFGVRHWLRPD